MQTTILQVIDYYTDGHVMEVWRKKGCNPKLLEREIASEYCAAMSAMLSKQRRRMSDF